MELISFQEYLDKYNFPLAVTIGSFDGIHLGHQRLISHTTFLAQQKGYKSAVITFDPHPLTVINKACHQNITTIKEKFDIIKKFNIDFLIYINFNESFSKISKTNFINDYLLKLNVKDVVVGDDFKFGYRGEGNASEITSISEGKIITSIIDIVKIDNEKIGSSKIIQLLHEGNIELVNQLLGYNYYFSGVVVKGRQIGRSLGFPTANINNNTVKKLLKTGVYGVNVTFDNKTYLGMMNLGNNPTCNFTDELSLEINVFNFNNELYNKTLKIEVFCYVRNEMKFKNKEELISQLTNDKKFIINKNHILAKNIKK